MEITQLPDRTFAAGEEPIGDRVNTYRKPKRIESILDALEPEEVEFLRNSTFGKIISLAENPSFSGSFGQFVIVRVLRVKKKYEIWFLFAGKPIRMSLHEFASVTGLNFGKIPKRNIKRKKNPIKEKLYWGEMFGSLKFCAVDTAIEMLKKRKVKGREMRLKYACLAFTSSVLLPTSHFPRIITEHVEMIRDLDEFLKYPWGRVSFEMLVTGIKKKDEISLAQSSLALPGFVDVIQLVFMAAVPQIKEVVTPAEPVVVIDSDSDSDSGDMESQADETEVRKPPIANSASVRYCVNPAHVRELDEECKVDVTSMLVDATHTPDELTWEDELEDVAVDNLVRLIEQGHVLKNSMFRGGLSAADLTRMRAEKKQKEKETKDKKDRENPTDLPEGDTAETYDVNYIANLVGRIVTPKIEEAVAKSGEKLEERLGKLIKAEILNLQGAVIQSIIGLLGKANDNVGPVGDANGGGVEAFNVLPEQVDTPVGPHVEKLMEPHVEKLMEPEQVEKVINNVISDLGVVLEESEVAPGENQTSIPITVETGVEGDQTMEDAADSTTDTDPATPLPGENTNSTHHHLSPVDEEGSTFEEEDELMHEKGVLASVTDALPNNDIAEIRQSKRPKVLPSLFNDYQCDPRIKAFRLEGPVMTTADNVDEIYMTMRERASHNKSYTLGNGYSLTTDELDDIVDRNHQMKPKVMDVLMYYINLDRNRKGTHQSKIALYDTSCPALLMKQYGRVTKTAIKDRYRLKFDEAVVKSFIGGSTSDDIYDCIYFPFFIDKQHWVGVCIDFSARAVKLLDCNPRFRSESMMKKDLNPITVVVPYILASLTGNTSADGRNPYEMVRVTGVPHNANPTDSAATTVLLIQAHAANGGDGFKDVNPETLSSGAKHLAVLVYRDITPV